MNGRGVTAGLLLLGALAFCAYTAPIASAGTTAFTCAPEEAKVGFSDAHCDSEVSEGAKFVHKEIAPKESTNIEITNEKTANETTEAQDSTLTGLLGGAEVTITCKNISGTGSISNDESSGMRVQGSTTIVRTECTVTKPTNPEGKPRCLLTEPFVISANFQSYQNETEMGLEFTPKEGGVFGAFTLTENEKNKCTIKGTYNIAGSFKTTPGGTAQGHGATLKATEGMSSLSWGGNPYTLAETITMKMSEGGNAITLTTT